MTSVVTPTRKIVDKGEIRVTAEDNAMVLLDHGNGTISNVQCGFNFFNPHGHEGSQENRHTISIFGSLITRMALPFVAILVLGAGAFEVALVRSIDLLAALLFGLLVGAWVDRLRRRPVRLRPRPGRAARDDPDRGCRRWLTLPSCCRSFGVAIQHVLRRGRQCLPPVDRPRDGLVRQRRSRLGSAEFTPSASVASRPAAERPAQMHDAVSFISRRCCSSRSADRNRRRRWRPRAGPREICEGLAIIARVPIIRHSLASMAMATLGVPGAI
jgi:hypothetical protein